MRSFPANTGQFLKGRSFGIFFFVSVYVYIFCVGVSPVSSSRAQSLPIKTNKKRKVRAYDTQGSQVITDLSTN